MTDDKEQAQMLKEQGNEAFRKKRFYTAIQKYTKSLEVCADPVVFSNRAQAELNVDLNILAQMDCTAAIGMDEAAPKSYYRRAQALKALGLFELALKDMNKCVELSNDAAMVKLKTELDGKKNTPMVQLCPVERDEYLQSQEELVDVPISFDESLFAEQPRKAKSVPKSDKQIPFVPRDFYDFAAAVSYLAKEPLLLAEYFLVSWKDGSTVTDYNSKDTLFQTIDLNSYHQLLDELLDDTTAALICKSLLQYLRAGHRVDDLADRLLEISELNRFDVIIVLMSSEDRANILAICEYLSAEDSLLVRHKYGC